MTLPPIAPPGALTSVSDVARANAAGGFFFFSPDTLKFFGDTLSSFALRERGGRLCLERVRRAKNAPAGVDGRGELRPVNPATGEVGLALDAEARAAFLALPLRDNAAWALGRTLGALAERQGVLAIEPDANGAGGFVVLAARPKPARRRYRVRSGRVYAFGASRPIA